MMEAYLERLRADPLEKLRWYVSKALGIAPYAQTDQETVLCGLHLVLERENAEASGNPDFDRLRFVELREEESHGA
ncbi:MAG: hypothetical protein ACOX81_02395 [Candidatus Heteroscillospira sp.]|jgi:hypothetical protein